MKPPQVPNRPPWIFAAKTTFSALLALLSAFTFNLDQPQWTLLTVFIVSQPRRDGLVLAKSFFRIIGTLVGAVVALVLVSAVAQERVPFLGALAAWVGICTFGSQYAQGWAAYGFVLSGYTVAIVGIPAALDPGNAFYIAIARVTEVSLGIICAAGVGPSIFPETMAASLRQTISSVRQGLGDYAVAVLQARGTLSQRAELLRQAAAIEDQRRAAIFEDRDIRAAQRLIAHLTGTLIDVLGSAQLLANRIQALQAVPKLPARQLERSITEAAAAIREWQGGAIGADSLGERLLRAQREMRSAPLGAGAPHTDVEDVSRQLALSEAREDFLAALIAYADADQAFASNRPIPASLLRVTRPNNFAGAFWTGLRSALAVALPAFFWVLTAWPRGSTATLLAAVATARLATMGHAVPLAIATSLIFSLATFPAFIVVDVLLPQASGFPMFALIISPMLLLCALLMANEKTMVIGYMSALLFASLGAFQDRMVYDPVALVNAAIAAVVATGSALVLWAVIAPEGPRATRRRFVRAARGALASVSRRARATKLWEFESAMCGALLQFRTGLVLERPADAASLEAGMELLGAGRELISLPASRTPLWNGVQLAISRCLAELRRDPLDLGGVSLATREIRTRLNELAESRARQISAESTTETLDAA